MKYFLLFFMISFYLSGEDNSKQPKLEDSVFSIKDNKVYIKEKLLPTIDVNSFRILNAICHGDEDKHCFGADKKRVYYYSRELPNSDPETFRFIGNGYSADKKNVYYIMDNSFQIIKEAESKSFEVISDNYAKDKKYVYFSGQRIKGSHSNSFKLISEKGTYDAQDKFQFYIEGQTISKKRIKRKRKEQ